MGRRDELRRRMPALADDLRDAMVRIRCGLPVPDVDRLLERAAEALDLIEDDLPLLTRIERDEDSMLDDDECAA